MWSLFSGSKLGCEILYNRRVSQYKLFFFFLIQTMFSSLLDSALLGFSVMHLLQSPTRTYWSTSVAFLRLVSFCFNRPGTFLDRLYWDILVTRRAGGNKFWWSLYFLTRETCLHHIWEVRYFWRSKNAFESKFSNASTQISLFQVPGFHSFLIKAVTLT